MPNYVLAIVKDAAEAELADSAILGLGAKCVA